MSAHEYVPVSDIPSLGVPGYAHPERIVFKTDVIQRLAALAGYHGDIQIQGYAGDTTQQSVAIGGFGGQGVATAVRGRGLVRRADPGSIDFGDQDPLVHRRGDLVLNINTNKVREDIAGKRERDPKVWAHALHLAAGRLLSRAAWKHLVREAPASREMLYDITLQMIMQAASGVAMAARTVPFTPSMAITTEVMAYGGAIVTSTMSKMLLLGATGNRPFEACFSLFPIIHPDRALATTIGSKLFRLTKVIALAA